TPRSGSNPHRPAANTQPALSRPNRRTPCAPGWAPRAAARDGWPRARGRRPAPAIRPLRTRTTKESAVSRFLSRLLTSLDPRSSPGARRKPSGRRPTPTRPCLEALEERCVLSNNIIWTNEGLDGFDLAYKQDAGKARALVHQAISDWRKVIADF